jgi:hypothetical protein
MEKPGHGSGARLAAMCFPHYYARAPHSRVTMTDSSTQGIKTVLHPVSGVTKARAVYSALLGMAPQHDADYYVGFDTEGRHIGLVPGGGRRA